MGSNSVLLLVEERSLGKWTTVKETSEVTALGEGVRSTGRLSDGAMNRTLAAIERAFAEARSAGVNEIRAAATMAARIANNADEFLRRAEEQGTPIRVLSGDDEARLGFQAAADDPFFSSEPRITVIDVGGHSTELVTADRASDGWSMRFRRSLPIGTLGLVGECLPAENPSANQLLATVVEIDSAIGLCYLRGEAGAAVALGATATNLVTVRDEIRVWDPGSVHGRWLDFEDVSGAVARMMPMSEAERRRLPGMEPGRERTLPAGALILERFLQATGSPGCFVSVRGWRHALLENDAPLKEESS